LGSGRLALPSLEGLCAVRKIEEIAVFSPTAEHREAFARKATEALGIKVTPVASAAAATEGVDIVAVVTVATHPALTADLVAPGVHVTSIGEPHEVDASVYLRADQVVASSVHQEMNAIDPAGQRISQRKGLEAPPLWDLLTDGRLPREALIELGDIVAGNIPARNGPSDINVFRESQGGVGDIALASLAYERARALGRGTEVAM
jgi:ornithine cyclodeaminase/alanine dehydrogenase-like protein (mu-crystallin family)